MIFVRSSRDWLFQALYYSGVMTPVLRCFSNWAILLRQRRIGLPSSTGTTAPEALDSSLSDARKARMREAAADGPFPLALAFDLGFVPLPFFIGLGDPEAFFIAALFFGLGDPVKSTI